MPQVYISVSSKGGCVLMKLLILRIQNPIQPFPCMKETQEHDNIHVLDIQYISTV